MHYATADRREHLKHGLTHDPFKALVAPRPIGWISTVSPEGVVNLAPYSFFNAVSDTPPMIMFASSGRKDTLRNVEATGEFTCSIATEALVDAMNLSSATVTGDVSEFELTGLDSAPSLVVKPPRVAFQPRGAGMPVVEGAAAARSRGSRRYRGVRRGGGHLRR